MKFVLNQAEDDTVDGEYQLLHDDGTDTGIAIQDCRSYGGGFSVNQYMDEGGNLVMTSFGTTDSFEQAKAMALKAAEQG